MDKERLRKTISMFLIKGATWKYLERRVSQVHPPEYLKEFYKIKKMYEYESWGYEGYG